MADYRKKYSAAKRLIPPGEVPTWVNDFDAARIGTYGLYEKIYWTEPGTFKLQQRGKDENPIYLPSGRIIVNTINRYVGKEFGVAVDPDFGTPVEQAEALVQFRNLFKRERLGSRFNSGKIFGTVRGDWFWHITGNPDKPEGSRLSVKTVHPGKVFPLYASGTIRPIGYDIAEQVTIEEEVYVKRTRYLKSEHPEHPSGGETPGGPISFQVDVLETEGWQGDGDEPPKVVESRVPVTTFPPEIINLPVYHIKNFEDEDDPWGSSEMRGLERIMAGINQSVSDEELALALQGLGMYKSDKGQPRDPVTGNPTTWKLGPGAVVHDESFARVDGVKDVDPMLDHIKFIEDRMNRVNGASDVAQGIVEVSVAESGIALELRLGPIMESARLKNELIQEVMDQMLFDLRAWLSVYESINVGEARVVTAFGSMLPKNNAKRFDELLQMVSSVPPLITMAYFRDAVRELGHDIPVDMDGAAIAAEQQEFALAVDPFGDRIAEEGGEPAPLEEE